MTEHLFSEVGRTVSDYWFCRDCPVCPDHDQLARDDAIRHVKTTGHEVRVRHESEYTLAGVRT